METQERRYKQRFPIVLGLRYAVRTREDPHPPLCGQGQTENISSSGLSFRCSENLRLGSHIELEVVWPVPKPDSGELRLSISGCIIRSGDAVAVKIGQHWFETVTELSDPLC